MRDEEMPVVGMWFRAIIPNTKHRRRVCSHHVGVSGICFYGKTDPQPYIDITVRISRFLLCEVPLLVL